MGSHHCQGAILVLDDKLDCFGYHGKNLPKTKMVYLFIPSFVVWISDVKFCPKSKRLVAQTGIKVELKPIVRKQSQFRYRTLTVVIHVS